MQLGRRKQGAAWLRHRHAFPQNWGLNPGHSTSEPHPSPFQFYFETGSCSVAQAVLELVLPLPQSPCDRSAPVSGLAGLRVPQGPSRHEYFYDARTCTCLERWQHPGTECARLGVKTGRMLPFPASLQSPFSSVSAMFSPPKWPTIKAGLFFGSWKLSSG